MKLIDADLLKEELDGWALDLSTGKYYVRDEALIVIDEMPSITYTETPEFIKADPSETQPPRAPKVLKYTRPASEFTSLKENIYLYYCGWCGMDIRRDDRYCRNCGRKVDWDDRQRENDS